MKIREEYRKRKRENGDEDEDDGAGGRQGKKRKKGKGKGTVDEEKKEKVGGILPGESLEHYNKCVYPLFVFFPGVLTIIFFP